MPLAPPGPPSPTRRVGAMFDADHLPHREREMLRGITRHADAAGWQLDLDPHALHHTTRPWDGLLVPTRKGSGKLLHLWSIPAVCLGWSQKHVRVGRAIESRYAAGRLAARHLVERGYRSFAYVGFSRAVGSWYERDRFTRELRRLGRDASTARTFATYARERRGWDAVMRALGEMLDKLPRPVGLFVARPGFARALADLVAHADARHILMSYNSEGLIPPEAVTDTLATRGNVEVFSREYRRFRSDSDHAKRRYKPCDFVEERLYYVKTQS